MTTTFSVHVWDHSSFRYSSTHDDAIGRALYWRGLGGFEPETIRVFSRLVGDGAGLFVDIGAHTGLFSLVACAVNPHVRVIAFEPVPRVFERLKAQLAANNWEHRCQARAQAVSNACGTARFHVPPDDLPTSASLNPCGFRNARGHLIDVPVTTIDSECAGLRVDLVKIDVEGFEDRVLDGMRAVLATASTTIVVECNPDGPYRAIQHILGSYGYRFYHLRGTGAVPLDAIIPDSTEAFRNYLCVPPGRSVALQ